MAKSKPASKNRLSQYAQINYTKLITFLTHISCISEECFEWKIVIGLLVDFLMIKYGYGTFNQTECKWYV